MAKIQTITPVDGSVYHELEAHSLADVSRVLDAAREAQWAWGNQAVTERVSAVRAFAEALLADGEDIAKEISWQMGRPVSQTPGELKGFAERAHHMLDIAPAVLTPHRPAEIAGFDRWVERTPLGVVAVLSPWNYPLLTSVNAIVPALAAGNVVVLKHSGQTPLVAERYAKAAATAGLPDGVFQILHLNHADTASLIADKRTDGVFFTGSVAGGLAVQQAIGEKFIPCGLELGGKDPAYVREDADLDYAVENLVDGAFFNSGQSCCGIERIYVHQSLYTQFVEGFVAQTQSYQLGHPFEAGTNLGPMVKASAADFVRGQIQEAVQQGARALVDESQFAASEASTAYLAPQVMVDVDHSMRMMHEESFGPVVGIMPVRDDAQAVQLMNDSDYGLTASLWTEDEAAVRRLGPQIQTGTLFMNRADYLDPALAWTGVKNTGRGVTLSALGYEHVTRAKSYHLRLQK